jgi:PAS domain S-box-containing protein
MTTTRIGRKVLVGAVLIAALLLVAAISVNELLSLAGLSPTQLRETGESWWAQPSSVLTALVWTCLVMILVTFAWLVLVVRHEFNERERLEQLHAQTNSFLESLIENIPLMIFVKDAQQLRFVRFNRAGEQLLGYSRQELLGKNDFDFFPAEQAQFFVDKDRQVLHGGDILEIPEEEIDTRHHGRRTLYTLKVPLYDRHKTPTYLLGISLDITQQKAAERNVLALNTELANKSALLQESNRDLEDFCHSVSHDLRAPLRAIDGFASLIQDDANQRGNAENLRHLQTIRAAAQRMSHLIDDLLEFSRVGQQTVSQSSTDMLPLVQQAITDVTGGRPQLRVRFDVQSLPPAFADARMLSHVWTNLIDNAVKYSASTAEPIIAIGGEFVGDSVRYFVRDNGVGFDMSYYDKLFGVFQRLHSAREVPGTGVGLAIVHRAITRLQGKVWAESSPNRGATFYFSLPCVPSEAQAA